MAFVERGLVNSTAGYPYLRRGVATRPILCGSLKKKTSEAENEKQNACTKKRDIQVPSTINNAEITRTLAIQTLGLDTHPCSNGPAGR